MLSMTAASGQSSLVFATVFFLVWVGAAVVTLNAQLLGGTLSFFQTVCVLGYCIFPLNISAALCFIWRTSSVGSIVYRASLVIAGFMWATRASVVFVSGLVPPAKRALAVYPVFLFYVVIGWLIFVQ